MSYVGNVKATTLKGETIKRLDVAQCFEFTRPFHST